MQFKFYKGCIRRYDGINQIIYIYMNILSNENVQQNCVMKIKEVLISTYRRPNDYYFTLPEKHVTVHVETIEPDKNTDHIYSRTSYRCVCT